MTQQHWEPDWSACPEGKVMLAVGALILILLGTLTIQVRSLRDSSSETKERLKGVETDVKWICREIGSDLVSFEIEKTDESQPSDRP